MKLALLTLSFILFIFGAIAQKNIKLTGEVINPTGEKVYLYVPDEDVDDPFALKYLDSAKVSEDGSFELNASIDETRDVVFFDGNEIFTVILSPDDNIHLTFNTLYFDETLQFSGKGSEKNNALVSVYLIDEIHSRELQAMANADEIDTVAIFDLQEKNHETYIQLINDFKDEIPGFQERSKYLIQAAERGKNGLKKYLRSKIAFEKKMKPLLNNTAIDFKGINLEGEEVSLSDFKGKITVVDFWATWCGPCKAEFPAYKELEEKYGDEVNFVSVGVYCKEDDWRKMAKDEGFKHNIYISKEEQDQISAYEVRTIPRYLVLDEEFNLIDADAPRPSSGKLESYWK